MPRNLKGGQVEGDCVPLTWQRPSGVVSRREASLLGYNVYSVQPDKTEWTIAHEDTLVKREGHLVQLLPAGDYKFGVSAQYKDGESELMVCESLFTIKSAPKLPPPGEEAVTAVQKEEEEAAKKGVKANEKRKNSKEKTEEKAGDTVAEDPTESRAGAATAEQKKVEDAAKEKLKANEKENKPKDKTEEKAGDIAKAGPKISLEFLQSIQTAKDMNSDEVFARVTPLLAPTSLMRQYRIREAKDDIAGVLTTNTISCKEVKAICVAPEKLTAGSVCDMLRLGKGKEADANRAEVARIVALCQGPGPVKKGEQMVSLFSNLLPGEVEALALSLGVQANFAFDTAARDQILQKLPGQSSVEKENYLEKSIQIMELAMSGLEQSTFHQRTHGGMHLVKAVWTALRNYLRQ